MIRRLTFIFIFLLSQSLISQELFFHLGNNSTTYDYKNSLGQSNPNLRPSKGSFYELGYEFFWIMPILV